LGYQQLTFVGAPHLKLDRPNPKQRKGVIMAVNRSTENLSASGQRVIAFFSNTDDAYRAVAQLKDAGFTSEEIGVISRSDRETAGTSSTTSSATRDESFWDKLKNFFSGDDSDNEDVEYREASRGMNWDQDRADYYYSGIGRGGALVSVSGPRSEEARRILQSAGGDLRESGFERTASTGRTGTSAGEQDYRIQLRGEVLRTFRERVQRGEVRLRKEVVTENKTVQVPVSREELVIERTAASGHSPANAGEIGTDQEIRVPLSEERARVEKQPVVNEEVRVGKRAVQNTENVSQDVRHEELRVDKEGDVEVDTQTGRKSKKPAA
jgi:uncharacterized protein (TIGR02271 family)